MEPPPHITICVCTYRRPSRLGTLLHSLADQETEGRFTYSIAVADNDAAGSARRVVEEFRSASDLDLAYGVEPRQNIALARNLALSLARGEFVAFIDDDEQAEPRWLFSLWKTCQAQGVDGVLGPVVPRFEAEAPAWALRGGFFERPRHPTGHSIGLADARTGNLLLRRELVDGDGPVFDPALGTGGEDVDFFRRMMRQGRRFVWCDEAVVHELVPRDRCSRRYLLRRAWLRGQNSYRQPGGRAVRVLKSCLATPVYLVSLPFLRVAGEHYFLKVLIKCCDHGGRLGSLVGLRPVKQREP